MALVALKRWSQNKDSITSKFSWADFEVTSDLLLEVGLDYTWAGLTISGISL